MNPGERLRVHRFDLPLHRPFSTGRGVLTSRRGWILSLGERLSECSLLPGWHSIDEDRVETELRGALVRAGREPRDPESLAEAERSLPPGPVRFAFQVLRFGRLALPNAGPIAASRNATASSPRRFHSCLLIDSDPTAWESLVQKAISRGFRWFKIKLARHEEREERRALRALADATPSSVRLRLDPNRKWTSATLREWAPILRSLGERLHFVEEPCDSDVRTEAAALGLPLCLDESALGWMSDGASAPLPRAVAIKPSLWPDVATLGAHLALARAAGVEIVPSSAVESGAGLLSHLHLLADWSHEAPGLGTRSLLVRDLDPGAAVLEEPDYVPPFPRFDRLDASLLEEFTA